MSIYRKLIISGIIGLVIMAIIFGLIMLWTATTEGQLKDLMPGFGTTEYHIFFFIMNTTEDDDLRDFLRLIWLLSKLD